MRLSLPNARVSRSCEFLAAAQKGEAQLSLDSASFAVPGATTTKGDGTCMVQGPMALPGPPAGPLLCLGWALGNGDRPLRRRVRLRFAHGIGAHGESK